MYVSSLASWRDMRATPRNFVKGIAPIVGLKILSSRIRADSREARRDGGHLRNPIREIRERAASVILISLPLELAPLFVGGFKQLLVKQDKSIERRVYQRAYSQTGVHCRVKQTLRRASLGKGRRDA